MTATNGAAPVAADPWEDYFYGLELAARTAHRAHWERLKGAHTALAASHAGSGLSVAEVERLLARAAERLKLFRPYRVVVVGETGAGKSTLINACLGRPLQKAMSGGAVTGTATHIFPASDAPADTAKVIFRSEPEFIELIGMLAQRYGLALPATLDQLEAFLARADRAGLKSQRLPEHIVEQVLHDIADIARSWRRLRDAGRLGEVRVLKHFDLELLARLVEEDGDRIAGGAAREVPGVARAEIHLAGQGGPEQMRHVVLIDTPGLGARRLRHREVMQLEIAQADAVILVVNAERPVKQGEALEAILRAELFHGYTDAERDAFAAKVFLVVNRYDRIQKPEEQQLLAASVEEIARTIAPGYLAHYGPATADCRCFQVSADAGYLARRLAEGAALGPEDARRFRSYLPLLGAEQAAGSYEAGWAASKLPLLLAALQRFLASGRLRLSLSEAERDLKAAARALREACKAELAAGAIPIGDDAQAAQALAQRRRQLSAQLLHDERRALGEAIRQAIGQLRTWQRSAAHRDELVGTVRAIYQRLGAALQTNLAELTQGDGLIAEAEDDVSGSVYVEARVYALLLELERRLRADVEASSALLAEYYLEALRGAIGAGAIYERLDAAGHGQAYIEAMAPRAALSHSAGVVAAEFQQHCRSALLYELIQRPILLPQSAAESSVLWGIVAGVAPRIAEDGIASLMESVGVAGGLTRFAASTIGALASQLMGAVPEQTLASQLSTRHHDNLLAIPEPPLRAERQLVDEIAELLRSRDQARFQQLIGEQFALRLHTAVGVALVSIESLFFYQVGKLRRALEAHSSQIERLHLAQMMAQGAAEAPIVELLLGHHRSELAQAQRLAETLTGIDTLNIG